MGIGGHPSRCTGTHRIDQGAQQVCAEAAGDAVPPTLRDGLCGDERDADAALALRRNVPKHVLAHNGLARVVAVHQVRPGGVAGFGGEDAEQLDQGRDPAAAAEEEEARHLVEGGPVVE